MAAEHEIMGTLAPGTRLGVYEIVRLIGVGGMGVVYLARHLGLGRDVAIKTIRPERLKEKRAIRRFLREGRAAARVRHPHVVDVYDIGRYDNLIYMVMEYLEGYSLTEHLHERGRLTVFETAALLLPIVAALDSAHKRGVVHRDIKPSNIFLSLGPGGERVPKVLDFGISKVYANELPKDTTSDPDFMLGSMWYMSPEQAGSQESVDARTDQYSLGIIIYQCVTGVHPFGHASPYAALFKIMKGEFTPAHDVKPDLPAPLASLIETALSTDPKLRFSSMSEFAEPLLEVADDTVAARWRPAFESSSALVPLSQVRSSLAVSGRFGDSDDISLSSILHSRSWFARWWRPLMVVLCLSVGFFVGHLIDGTSSVEDSSISEGAPQKKLESAAPPPSRPEKTVTSSVDSKPPPRKRVEKVITSSEGRSSSLPQRRAVPRRKKPPKRKASSPKPVELGPNDAPIIEP
ncbi:MAG: serine/threonine-protein kinase [Myxococcota bacterium]